MKSSLVIFLLLLCINVIANSEPTLKIIFNGKEKVFTRSELLKRSDVETLTLTNPPAYADQILTCKAIKVVHLFKDIPVKKGSIIEFKALDGYNSFIPENRMLSIDPKKSLGYIAIEEKNKPWPKLKKSDLTAGPFYLVWPHPELSFVPHQDWPYQIASFEIKDSLKPYYPNIFPAENIKENDPISKGFEIYKNNCFACHTINHSGTAEIGPDLNVPMNPLEYMQKDAIKKLIRDPQSVRKWSASRMYGFNEKEISDKEISYLLDYLKHMSQHKVSSEKK